MTKYSARSVEGVSEGSDGIPQEHREDAPVGWPQVQDEIAAENGLSVLLVDGHQPPALVVSNNNSICRAFQSSRKHVRLCDPFCGVAYQRAISAGSKVEYKCHAGLQCFTMPVQIGTRKDLAIIGGRGFTSGADYRALMERFRAGELNELLRSNPFENVIFAEPDRLEKAAQRIEKATLVQSPKSKVQSREGVIDSSVKDSSRVDDKEIVPVETAPSELQRELDRLRGELAYRDHLDESLQSFLERISSTDAEKTYQSILTHSRELLQADRASLWVIDEAANEIVLRAGVGLSARRSGQTRGLV